MSWFYSGSTMKSLGESDCHVMDMIQQDDFKKEDLDGFCTVQEANCLDEFVEDPCSRFSTEDGWQESIVYILLSAGGIHFASEAVTPSFQFLGYSINLYLVCWRLHCRKLWQNIFIFSLFGNIGNQILKCPLSAFTLNSTLQMFSPESMKGYIRNPVSQGAVSRLSLLVLCSGQTWCTSWALGRHPSGQSTSSLEIYQSTYMQNQLCLQLTISRIFQKFVHYLLYMWWLTHEF